MAEQGHWELIFQSLERRILALCDSVKEQNATTNAAFVQLEGLAHRLNTLEAEVEAMKQTRRTGFRISPETTKRLIQIGAILALLALNAPDSHVGWVLSWLR